MKRNGRRIGAMLLALVMTLSLLPVSALAARAEDDALPLAAPAAEETAAKTAALPVDDVQAELMEGEVPPFTAANIDAGMFDIGASLTKDGDTWTATYSNPLSSGVATDGTVIRAWASSQQPDGGAAFRAVDGVIAGSLWHSRYQDNDDADNTDPNTINAAGWGESQLNDNTTGGSKLERRWIELDIMNGANFGDPVWLDGLRYYGQSNNGRVTKCEVRVSATTDGDDWVVVTPSNDDWTRGTGNESWAYKKFDGPVLAQRVRLYGVTTTSAGGNQNMTAREIRLVKVDESSAATRDVTVTVKQSDNVPIADATVTVGFQTKTTNENGEATFTGLLSDWVYTAKVTKDTYASGVAEIAASETAATVTLIQPSAAVTGKITADGTDPVTGATVELVQSNASYSFLTGDNKPTAPSGGDGSYSLSVANVADGTYYLRVSKDGHGAKILNDLPITVASGQATSNVILNTALPEIDTSGVTYQYDMTEGHRPSLGRVSKNETATEETAKYYVPVNYAGDKMKLSFTARQTTDDGEALRSNRLVTLLGTNMKNGVIEFDASRAVPEGGSYTNKGRFGLLFRMSGFTSGWIFVGQWNNDTQWSREYLGNAQNWEDNGSGVTNRNGPSFTSGDTRHFKVTVNGKALTVEVDGITVIETANMEGNNNNNVFCSVPTDATDVAFVCGNGKGIQGNEDYGVPSDITIDNLYVTRTDPSAQLTLTNPTTGTLSAKRQTSVGNLELVGGSSAFEGDPIEVRAADLAAGMALAGLTVTKKGGGALSTAELAALNIKQKQDETTDEYYCTFEMPNYNINVAGVVVPLIQSVSAAVDNNKALKVNKTITATATLAAEGSTEGITYQWSHENSADTWQECSDGTAAQKTIKSEDLNKRIKVVVKGDNVHNVGTAEWISDGTVQAADTPLTSVTIRRDTVYMVANAAESDDNTDANVGKTTTLTATIEPAATTLLADDAITWTIWDAETSGNQITSSSDAVVSLAAVTGHSEQQKVTANKVGTVWVQVEVKPEEQAENAVTTDRVKIVVTNDLVGITLKKNGSENPIGENEVITIYANTDKELQGQSDKINKVVLDASRDPGDNTDALYWKVIERPTGVTSGGIQVVTSNENSLSATIQLQQTAEGSSETEGEGTAEEPAINSADFLGKLGRYKVQVSNKEDPGEDDLKQVVTFELRRYVNRDISLTIQEVQDQTKAPKYGQHLTTDIQGLAMSDAGKSKLKYEWFALNSADESLDSATPFKTLTGEENGKTITLENSADLDLIGKFIAVRITADSTNTYYDGSRYVVREQKVAKADGPAVTNNNIKGVKATDDANQQGKITGFGDTEAEYGKYEYAVKPATGDPTDWTTPTGNEVTVPAGNYVVRVKETATHSAGTTFRNVVVPTHQSDMKKVNLADMTNGTIERDPAQADPGTSVALIIKPNTGYELSTLTVTGDTSHATVTTEDGKATEDGYATKTFTMPSDPAEEVTVSATFEKIDLTIGHSALVNLQCSKGSAESHTVKYGDTAAITLVPKTGYTLPAANSIKVYNVDDPYDPKEIVGGWTFSVETGTITFTGGVIHNLSIEATGVARNYDVTRPTGGILNFSNQANATFGQDYNATLSIVDAQKANYDLPDTITVKREDVTVNEDDTTTTETVTLTAGVGKDYTYDASTGNLTIKAAAVTGKLIIEATAKHKVFTVTAVTVNGTAMVDSKLTVASITPSGAVVTYQWQRADSNADNATWSNITNATKSEYTLTADDQGKYVRVAVTGVNDNTTNFYTGTAYSTAVQVAAKVVPATGVTIAAPEGSQNKVVFGSTLQLTATVAPSDTTETTVKWRVGNTASGSLVDVNETTGVVTAKKVGTATIQAVVMKADGTEGVSNTIQITVGPKIIADADVRLDGTLKVNETLSLVLPDGVTVRDIMWYRVKDDAATLIETASGTSYTLQAADKDHQIKVTMAGTDNYTGNPTYTTSGTVRGADEQVPTYTVTFTLNNATLEVVSGGTAEENVVTVAENASLTFKLTAPTDKVVAAVTLDDNSTITANDNGVYTIPNVAANRTVTVTVDDETVDPTAYAITITPSDNGTVTAKINNEAATTAEEGDTVTLTVTAATGYELGTLTVKDADDGDVTLSKNNTFTMPAKAVTVTATFVKKSTLTIAADPTSLPNEGGEITLTVTADPADGEVTVTCNTAGIEVTDNEDGTYSVTLPEGKGVNYTFKAALAAGTLENGTAYTAAEATCTVKVGTKPSTSSSNRPTTTTETKPDGTKVTTVTDNRTGTVTETTEKPDGTKEIVETKKDGTVTETVETPDGTTETVETKPDGTVTEVVKTPDGAKEFVETKPDGTVTEAVTDPEGARTEKVTTPDKAVTITVTDPEGEEVAKVELPAEVPAPETKFVDIDNITWAKDSIDNVAGLKLVNGVGNDRYDPVAPMTRGALATVLHRLSQGNTNYEAAFKDVAKGEYYTEGVAWAAKVKVVTGYTAEIFAPNDVITREQLAVMLARYAKLIGMDTAADKSALNTFVDGGKTGDWAVDGVAWAVKTGILKGKGANDLDPTAKVTRAEVAVMLDRFIALMK